MLGQLAQHLLGVGVLTVDLVQRHDDRNVGRPCVVECLDRLGHDPVVGGHHQDDDVRRVGTARPHGGEGLVAGSVDEGEAPTTVFGLVGADVLGDTTCLVVHDVGAADLVEQLGLAVIDVAHHGDDRWAERCIVVVEVVDDVEQLEDLDLLLLARIHHADLGAQFGGEQLDHVV